MFYIKNQKFLKIAKYIIAFTMFVALIEFVRTLVVFDSLNDMEKITIKDNYLRPLLLYFIGVAPWLILYIINSENKNSQTLITPKKKVKTKIENFVKYFNGIGILVGLWVLIYPYPYLVAILSSIIFSFLFIALPAILNGKITLDEEEKKKPSLQFGLISVGFAGFIRALLDNHLLTFKTLNYPTLFYFLTLLLLVIVGGYKFKYGTLKEFGKCLYILLALYLHSGLTMININCNFGYIKQAQEKVSILDMEADIKSMPSKRRDEFYLILDKTKNRIHYDKISVPKDLYQSCVIGDEIILKYYKGFFDAEFFEVEKKKLAFINDE